MTSADPNLLPVQRSDDGIATLSLMPNPSKMRGGVVVLDDWLLDAIDGGLDRVEQGEAPRGFILASASERVFVAGADLAEIDALDDEALLRYLEKGARVYQRIAALECPTVAAVNGACLGGGLEIAMHCDVLIGAVVAPDDKPWRIGLPEAGLGLCPGWGGTQMLPARMDPALAVEATCSGATFKATEIPDGLVEILVPRRDLLDAASEWIRDHSGAHADRIARGTPASIDSDNGSSISAGLESARPKLADTDAARAVTECVETGIRDGWNAALEAERRLLTGLRHTPAAREKLESFLARA
ncbi:MAG: enoyl-CoA hydratase/isomerase family protein [Phycisphaera sp.]|nr:enoyl-CoA hydratase/isomerase family protein [Phycisphaera sp.]